MISSLYKSGHASLSENWKYFPVTFPSLSGTTLAWRLEHNRRDTGATVLSSHICNKITSTQQILHKQWKENVINCRDCKRSDSLFLTDQHSTCHMGSYLWFCRRYWRHIMGCDDWSSSSTKSLVHMQCRRNWHKDMSTDTDTDCRNATNQGDKNIVVQKYTSKDLSIFQHSVWWSQMIQIYLQYK